MTTKVRSLLAVAGFAAAASFTFAQAGSAAPADKYPLTTCVVSGDKLGEMGDPVKYTYKQAGKPDRVLEFCCKDCIKDFEKDPAKYLARLDAAAAGKPIAADSKKCEDGACCGGDDKKVAGNKESCADDASCALVKAYLPVAEALASDDLSKAREAAATLATAADKEGAKTVAQPALAVVHAGDIKAARAAFKTLSQVIAPMAEKSKEYVVMNCPMAQADWVQTGTSVRNPYFGKMMLTCGAPKKG